MGSNVQQASKLLMESFIKQGSTPRFQLSLRDFMDNFVSCTDMCVCVCVCVRN